MQLSSYAEMFRGKPARFTIALVLTLAWTLAEFLSLFIGGVPAFNAYWVVACLARLVLIGVNLWFVTAFFRDGRQVLYGAFRKYVGYAVVLAYGAANLPILAWQDAGQIGSDGAFVLWLVAAIQALLMMGLWLCLRLKGSQVYWGFISSEEAADKKLLLKRLKETRRGPLGVVVENADMFIQTVFIVILLQQFIFQLYVIPSESMVPTMLIGDRPFILKTLDGPSIPLSGMKMPTISPVKRGQIVVFESPAYRKPPLYTQVLQQFVFYLTLSLVDLDKDENGQPKVHYVVKRVTGEPGEKLMMIDDVLYVKTAADPAFKPQEQDAAFRHVDLWKEDPAIRDRINAVKVSEKERALLERWDARKNGLEPQAAAARLAGLARELQSGLAALSAANLQKLDAAYFNGDPLIAERQFQGLALAGKSRKISVFRDYENLRPINTLVLVRHLADVAGDRTGLAGFLTSAAATAAERADWNAYQLGSHQLNLIYKDLLARQFLAVIRLARANADPAAYGDDRELQALQLEAQEFQRYLAAWDERNFPEFPAGAGQFIPEGSYFLMGDNRYNSLDFRFSDPMEYRTRSLEERDPESMVYPSALAPRLLERSRIIGHLAFRLFPFDRIGLVRP